MILKSPAKSGDGILTGEFVRQGRDIEPNFHPALSVKLSRV